MSVRDANRVGNILRVGMAAGLLVATASGAARSASEPGALSSALDGLGLELGGQIRVRGEMDARDFASSTEPDFVIGERARLTLTAHPLGDLTGSIQIQDARVWGEESNTLNDSQADGLDLHQGYLEVKDFFGAPVTVRAGRQEVSFGEERLVGAVDWTQNARSLDGALVTYAYASTGSVKPFWFLLSEKDAVAAKGSLKQADPNVDEGKDDDVWIAGLHAQQKFLDTHVIEPHFYVLDDGSSDVQLYTLGAYANGSTGAVLGDASLVYNATFDAQLGDVKSQPIHAYLGVVHGGVKIAPVTVTVGYEYLTGDDDTQDRDRRAFDTLLATNHKFYGEMDYFLNNGADTASLGLRDLVGKLRAKLSDTTTLAVDGHRFETAVRDDTPGIEPAKRRLAGQRHLGEELDTWVTHAYDAHLDFRLGYSFFVPGDAMKARFRAQDSGRGVEPLDHGAVAHWAYLQANLTF